MTLPYIDFLNNRLPADMYLRVDMYIDNISFITKD